MREQAPQDSLEVLRKVSPVLLVRMCSFGFNLSNQCVESLERETITQLSWQRSLRGPDHMVELQLLVQWLPFLWFILTRCLRCASLLPGLSWPSPLLWMSPATARWLSVSSLSCLHGPDFISAAGKAVEPRARIATN